MYDLIIEDTTWFDARDKCLQRGGYLATITSQEEMNQIINQILSEGKEEITFYIGATRDYTYNFGLSNISCHTVSSIVYWLQK